MSRRFLFPVFAGSVLAMGLIGCGEEEPAQTTPPSMPPSMGMPTSATPATDPARAAQPAADAIAAEQARVAEAAAAQTRAAADAAATQAKAAADAAATQAKAAADAAAAEAAAKAKSMADSAVVDQAQSLLAQVTEYISAHKYDLAEQALTKLDGMKASLPESLQQKVEAARTLLKAKKAADSLGNFMK